MGLQTRGKSNPAIARAVAAVCQALEQRRLLSAVTFQSAVYSVGADPNDVIAGNFGPGPTPDLVVSTASGDVEILLANGGGTFNSPQVIANVNVPTAMAVGDFRGDGKLDLALGSDYSGGSYDLVVLLGNGDGTFQSPELIPMPSGVPTAVAVGDFNGDGNLDIAAANGSGDVFVFLGNGNGTFAAGTEVGIALDTGRQLEVADFNGDGIPDLLVSGGGSFSIFFGSGNGAFGSSETYSSLDAANVLVADTNGDGAPDVLFTTSGYYNLAPVNDVVGELVNNGNGTFALQTPLPNPLPHGADAALAAGDFQGYGTQDVLLATNDSAAGFTNFDVLFPQAINGAFQTYQIVGTNTSGQPSLLAADLNGDGKTDFVTLDNAGALTAFLNTTSFPPPLAAPGDTAPAEAVTGVPATPTFSWSAVSGATSYRIMIATDPDDLPADPAQSLGGSTVVIDASTDDTTFTPSSPLVYGRTYYWEVIGIGSGRQGTWSPISQFTVIPAEPAPVLNSPVNSSTENPVQPTFSWSAVSGASTYRLIVATDSADLPSDPTATTGGSTVVIDATTSSNSFTPSTSLSAGTTYYWEVIGSSTGDIGTWSIISSFVPGLPPPVPTNLNTLSGQSPFPTFSWSTVNGATTYRLIVATRSADLPTNPSATTGGSSVVIDLATSSTSYTPTTPLTLDTIYYWEVIAVAAGQTGAWSPISDFRTASSLGQPPDGYSPEQILQAYGINQVSFNGTAANGAGQTIAIVDDYNNPDIASDLAAFDGYYDLPAPPSFTVVDENGNVIDPADKSAPPSGQSVWISEIDLDVQWAHAIAPGANLLLVEALDGDLQAAVNEAADYKGVSVVSMSFGGSSFSDFPTSILSPAFVAATGDTGKYPTDVTDNGNTAGATQGIDYPAGFSNVLAVGATSLYVIDSAGDWGTESLWSDSSSDGSGYGVSGTVGEPSFQVRAAEAPGREVPDVVFDGDPNTGVAVYDSYDFAHDPSQNSSLWTEIAGTSFSTPAWAALVAIIDQGRVAAGAAALSASDLLSLLYTMPLTDFHKFGPNQYNAGTGLGSPIANELIPDMVNASTLLTAPPITSADATVFSVGTLGTFTITAPGVPTPFFSEAGLLPSGVNFTDNGNGTASLSGTPAKGTGATYTITLTSSNDIGTSSSQVFTLVVTEAASIASAPGTTFRVGADGQFTITSGGVPTGSISEAGALPGGVSFIDNGDGVATLAGTPQPGTGGAYLLTLQAANSFGSLGPQIFTLTVDEDAAITSSAQIMFVVGALGTFPVTTSGYPAASNLSESGALPRGVHFADSGDGAAIFSGTPAAGTDRTYHLTLTAANGLFPSITQLVTLTVDQTPQITSANHATFTAGANQTFHVTTTGFPAASLTETGVLPAGVTFENLGNGSAALLGQPMTSTGGIYPVTISASNNVLSAVNQAFTLTVDQHPAFTSAGQVTFTAGSAETFPITTTGFPVSSLKESGALPAGITFTDNGNGTGTISGTPAAGTGKIYRLAVTANNRVWSITQDFALTVDQAPAITSSAAATFTVGRSGAFAVKTTGFPTAAITETTGDLPAGVTLRDLHDGTAALSGRPAAGTGNIYDLTVSADNGIGSAATQSFTLTVDQAPAFTGAGQTTFVAGSAGSFTVTTSGFPLTPTLSQSGTLPGGLSFIDNGNGAATIGGVPAAGAGRAYHLIFTAKNQAGSATQSFTLTVDQAPAITSSPAATFTVGQIGAFTVKTTGFPTAAITETTGDLPAGVTLRDLHNGMASLSGRPAAGTGGAYNLTFSADNGVGAAAVQAFTFTVDQSPAFTSVNQAAFVAGSAGLFTVTTSGFPLAATWTETGSLPLDLSFMSNGDGAATISGTPELQTPGTYHLTLTARNSAGSARQSFTLTVM